MSFIKQHARKLFPGIYKRIKYLYIKLDNFRSVERVFTVKYKNKSWGKDNSVSGPGSNILATEKIRTEFPALINKYKIHSITDAGCGDYNWMKICISSEIKYIGIDIVQELIDYNNKKYKSELVNFMFADLVKTLPEKSDLILCRDMLVHLPFKKIKKVIANFKNSGSEILLITSFDDILENENIITGGWRKLNFQLNPFNFPEPVEMIYEYESDSPYYTEKFLGLWKLSELNIP